MSYRITPEQPQPFFNRYKNTYSTAFHTPLSVHVSLNTNLKTFITARKASDPQGNPVGWAILRKNKGQQNQVFFDRLAKRYKTVLPAHDPNAWGVYISAIQNVDKSEKGFIKKFVESYASPTLLNGKPSLSAGVGYYVSEVTNNLASLRAHLKVGFVIQGFLPTGGILLIKYNNPKLKEKHLLEAADSAFVGMQFGIIIDNLVEGVSVSETQSSRDHARDFLVAFKNFTMQRWEMYKQLYVGVGVNIYIPMTILAGNLAVTFAIAVIENFGVFIPPEEIRKAGDIVTKRELTTLWRRSANFGGAATRSIFDANTYDKTFAQLLELLSKHMKNEYTRLDPVCDEMSEKHVTNSDLLDKFIKCYTSIGEVASERSGTARFANPSYQNNMGMYGYIALLQPQRDGNGDQTLFKWPGNCTVTALIIADILRAKELYGYQFRVYGRELFANITEKLARLPFNNKNLYEPRPGGKLGVANGEDAEGWACHYGWDTLIPIKIPSIARMRTGNFNTYTELGNQVVNPFYKRKSSFNDRERTYDTITLNAFVRAIARSEIGLQPSAITAQVLTFLRDEFLPRIKSQQTRRMVKYGAVNTSK